MRMKICFTYVISTTKVSQLKKIRRRSRSKHSTARRRRKRPRRSKSKDWNGEGRRQHYQLQEMGMRLGLEMGSNGCSGFKYIVNLPLVGI